MTAVTAAQARGRDQHRAQRERERGGRVAARPGSGPDVHGADLDVGVGEQGLERLGAQRGEPHDGCDCQSCPRALTGEGHEHEHGAPGDEQQGVEQMEQDFAHRIQAGTAEQGEVVEGKRIPDLGGGHVLGDAPYEPQTEQAQPGDAQRAGGARSRRTGGRPPPGHGARGVGGSGDVHKPRVRQRLKKP